MHRYMMRNGGGGWRMIKVTQKCRSVRVAQGFYSTRAFDLIAQARSFTLEYLATAGINHMWVYAHLCRMYVGVGSG
jgi:hypothetical protein